MKSKRVSDIRTDEIALYDFFAEQVDWETLDEQTRRSASLILTVLMACVSDDRIDTEKLAKLTTLIAGGKFVFPGKS